MEIRRASQYTLGELTRFWNLGYTGYFVPVTFTDEMLANWLRCGDFDLEHSLVAMDGENLAGFSLLGVRGRRGWIGGFGVAPDYRGKGLAYSLFAGHVAHVASEMRLASLQLEVLEENWARKVYERAGMHVTRRLAILQGALQSGASGDGAGGGARAASPLALLEHHERLHRVCPAVWQREPGWIAKSLPAGAGGLFTGPEEAPTGFLLHAPAGEGIRILDAAAEGAEAATALVEGLAALCPGRQAVAVNEPEGGFMHQAFIAAGLAEVRAQFELKWEA